MTGTEVFDRIAKARTLTFVIEGEKIDLVYNWLSRLPKVTCAFVGDNALRVELCDVNPNTSQFIAGSLKDKASKADLTVSLCDY